MNATNDHVPDPRLAGLMGKPRREKYLELREEVRVAYRKQRRLPTRHAVVCAELRRACLLPAPGPDISADERRAVRNKLKAARKVTR